MTPFTTMCAACTSPSIRASDEMTKVAGSSATAATLPRTMPSTRSPPLKMTLPSMRVVCPMRLSMRFCGLLALLNTFLLPSPPLSEAHRVRRARLVRPGLVDTHLDILDLRLGADPESAFHAAEVLECQPERRCTDIGRLREGHHSIVAALLQIDHQLEAAIELALAPRARR